MFRWRSSYRPPNLRRILESTCTALMVQRCELRVDEITIPRVEDSILTDTYQCGSRCGCLVHNYNHRDRCVDSNESPLPPDQGLFQTSKAICFRSGCSDPTLASRHGRFHLHCFEKNVRHSPFAVSWPPDSDSMSLLLLDT